MTNLARLPLTMGVIAAFALARAAADQAPTVRLVDLAPMAVEWGTPEDHLGIIKNPGPGRTGSGFWTAGVKIVAEIDPDYRYPEGVAYLSTVEDCFGVEGEFMTGVGLWGRGRLRYHWLDYAIPAGATRFTGQLYTSDDPHGVFPPRRPVCSQQFNFAITIDGNEQWNEADKPKMESPQQADPRLKREAVFRHEATLLSNPIGSGKHLKQIDFAIPPKAQRIRFRLQISGWGDQANTELIIHDGRFHLAGPAGEEE